MQKTSSESPPYQFIKTWEHVPLNDKGTQRFANVGLLHYGTKMNWYVSVENTRNYEIPFLNAALHSDITDQLPWTKNVVGELNQKDLASAQEECNLLNIESIEIQNRANTLFVDHVSLTLTPKEKRVDDSKEIPCALTGSSIELSVSKTKISPVEIFHKIVWKVDLPGKQFLCEPKEEESIQVMKNILRASHPTCCNPKYLDESNDLLKPFQHFLPKHPLGSEHPPYSSTLRDLRTVHDYSPEAVHLEVQPNGPTLKLGIRTAFAALLLFFIHPGLFLLPCVLFAYGLGCSILINRKDEFLNYFYEETDFSLRKISVKELTLFPKFELSSIDSKAIVSSDWWAITLFANHGTYNNHANLLIEGIENGTYFMKRAHLAEGGVKPGITCHSKLPAVGYDDWTHKKNSHIQMHGGRTPAFKVLKSDAKKMISQIQLEKETGYEPVLRETGRYSLLNVITNLYNGSWKNYDSCFTWARDKLYLAGIDLGTSPLDLLIVPTTLYTHSHSDLKTEPCINLKNHIT